MTATRPPPFCSSRTTHDMVISVPSFAESVAVRGLGVNSSPPAVTTLLYVPTESWPRAALLLTSCSACVALEVEAAGGTATVYATTTLPAVTLSTGHFLGVTLAHRFDALH